VSTTAVALLRTAWAGLLCAVAVALAEALRAGLGEQALGVPDRFAILATALVVLLPAGLFAGAAAGGMFVALRVEDDPLEWLRRARLALHGRRASDLLGAAAGGVSALLVGIVAHRSVLAGDAAPDRAGFTIGLMTVGAILPAACVGLPVSAAVRGALGRRDGEGRGLLLLGLAALTGVALLVLGVTWRETLEAIDWRLPLSLCLAVAAFLFSLLLVWRVRALGRPGFVATVLVLVIGLGAHGLTALNALPTARAALFDSGGLLARAVVAAQRPFDRDGDGHAALLGGADCDDEASVVFPGADEVPDNGVDEDCTGADLRLASLAATSKAPAPAPPPPAGPPLPTGGPVILLSVDTLRPDHVGAYGYERPTTPHIDSLARESILFRRAYAPSNKTPSSLPAIWTGRYPSELSRTFHHFSKFDSRNRFVAEMLKDAGYRTGGVAAHWYFRRKYGLHQGIDDWRVVSRPGEQMERMATSAQVTDRTLEVLSGLEAGGNERFMLIVHYLDPHKWYIDHPGHEPFGRRAIDRYDGEIRFTDHHVGRLLKELRSRPWWDKAMVAFYSDHGEAFGEHGERFHGWSLYEHETLVPFLLKVPGLEPGVAGTPVALIDLVPTVLEFAAAPTEEGLRGTSLLPALRHDRVWPARPIYTEMPPGPHNPVVRALIDWGGRRKIIHRRWGNVYEVYDLQEDPREASNLASKRSVLTRMQDRLQQFRGQQVAAVRPRHVDG